jgi:hypothetical protein
MDKMLRKSIRNRDGFLQTPLGEFWHAETGSSIAIVGAMHIGSSPYYDELSEYLLNAEEKGAEIHYEGIKESNESNQAEVKKAAELSDSLKVVFEISADLFNAVKQRDEVRYSESWKNHDISIGELITLMGEERVQKIINDVKEIEKIHDEHPKLTEFILQRALSLMPTIGWLGEVGIIGNKHDRSVIITHRNNVALEAVRARINEEPEQDIALFWGAGHFDGLKKGIEAFGYRMYAKRWLGALSLK